MKTGLKKTLAAGVLVWCFLLLFAPLHGQAKLSVMDPDHMLEQADVIAAGTVETLEPGLESVANTGTIRLDAVLKGSVDDPVVVLKETQYMMPGSWLQRIPPAGTKVLVLLKKDGGGKPGYYNDVNHIAIVENGKVTDVYKGLNVSTQPYVEKYDAYYQQHIGQAVRLGTAAKPALAVPPDGAMREKPPVPDLKAAAASETGQKILGGAAVALVVALIVWYEVRVGGDGRSR